MTSSAGRARVERDAALAMALNVIAVAALFGKLSVTEGERLDQINANFAGNSVTATSMGMSLVGDEKLEITQ